MPSSDLPLGPEVLVPERAAEVRLHLDQVLKSPAFEGSKRAQSFLRLIVEHALAGRHDQLRERMIGAELFGRPIDYDTANDAIVRVKANEVRRKLAQYYQEPDGGQTLRIELVPGSYVPKFQWASPATHGVTSGDPRSRMTKPAIVFPSPPVAAQLAAAGDGKKSSRSLIWAGIAAGILVIGLLVFGFRQGWPGKRPAAEIRSIAVLPLENLSGNSEQDYFADGLTDELISDLGQLAALRVISRTSTIRYKHSSKTLPQIAHELNVDAVVEGSVLREGDRVRITAQLIDATSDREIWSRSFNRDLTSVLTLQGEVAHAIARGISVNVTPQEEKRLARTHALSSAAQDSYLQGTHLMSEGNPEGAVAALQHSVSEDPDYAPSHAALAASYGWVGELGLQSYDLTFPLQMSEASKAVELDDSFAEGHAELALAHLNLDFGWALAGEQLQQALQLNPNSASVHATYSYYLEKQGRIAEALVEMKRSLALDPVSGLGYSNLGVVQYYAREYDQALASFHSAVALESTPVQDFHIGVTYAEKGLYPQAVEQLQKGIVGKPHVLGHLANTYARMGETDKARALIPALEAMVKKTGIGRYELALVYAGLGQKDEAFAWLEKAYTVHDKGLTYLRIDPCLAPLRRDTRYADLLRRVGLPE